MPDTLKYPSAYKDVVVILQIYFDGLHHADSKLLAEIFHPDARYVNAVKGEYMSKRCARPMVSAFDLM